MYAEDTVPRWAVAPAGPAVPDGALGRRAVGVRERAKKTLDAAVAELDRAATEQGGLTRTTRGEVQRRRQLERTLFRKYVTPLANFARASLRGAPEFASLTPPARTLEREHMVRTAQAMAADQHVDALRAGDFPADFLEQLRAAATAVQRDRRAGDGSRGGGCDEAVGESAGRP